MRQTGAETIVVQCDDQCVTGKRRSHEDPEALLAWSLEHCFLVCFNSLMGLLFLQAYFFDAPEMEHLPTTTVVPNQTVVAAKSS